MLCPAGTAYRVIPAADIGRGDKGDGAESMWDALLHENKKVVHRYCSSGGNGA